MKLIIDVNLPLRLSTALASLGWEARRSTGFLAASALDEEILATAEHTGSVVVTRDQDFSFLASRPGRSKPSVVNLRVGTLGVDALAGIIDRVLRLHAEDLARGAILSVSDRGVRTRRLPVS